MEQDYFSQAQGGVPTADPFVADLNAQPPYPLAAGIFVRAVVGQQCMVNLVEIQRGGAAPCHSHAEEQIVVVLQGAVRFVLGGEERIVRVGEAVVIPPWVRHGAVGHAERSRTVEVFSPPRGALLALIGRNADPPQRSPSSQ